MKEGDIPECQRMFYSPLFYYVDDSTNPALPTDLGRADGFDGKKFGP